MGEKKKMKSDGKLDKYGRPNEATPAKWTSGYTDYNAPLEGPGSVAAPVTEKTSQSDVLAAPPVAPNGADAEAMDLDETAVAPPTTNGDAASLGPKEKRKKHDGETPEERAERKRRKKEKKDKKEKRRSGASKAGDSDESD